MFAQTASASSRIGVTGASGQVGYFLLPRLLAQGYAVVALSRQPRPRQIAVHTQLRWCQGALEQGWPDALPVECLLSAGPLDTLAAELDRRWPAALRQVVALSSTSIDSKLASPDPAECALAVRLGAAEAALRDACHRHGATLILLRPTLIYGCGRDRSLSPLLKRVRGLHVLPLPWPACGLRQPVHADDLAALMCACIGREDLDRRCFEIGGGERITFQTMLRRAARAAVGGYLALPVPVALLRLLLPQRRGALARLAVDLTVDDQEARRLLGWQPRAFHPTAADFENRTAAYGFRGKS